MTNTSWKLENNRARIQDKAVSGHVDTHAPQHGIGGLAIGGSTLEGHLLAVQFLPESYESDAGHADTGQADAVLVETYLRGDDVVATYAPVEHRPYRPQLYWRRHPTTSELPALTAIDLLVSVQTNRLDSHPILFVSSQMSAAEVWNLSTARDFAPVEVPGGSDVSLTRTDSAGCVLLRAETSAGQPISYAEMIHPSDFGQLMVRRSADGGVETEHHLFASFLEKGVIRRARLRGVLLERDGDVESAAAWYQALMRDALPLTT